MSLSPPERTRCVADGFRFYALLYRLLAGVFALLSLVLFWLNQAVGTSWFYGVACSLGALYLWNVSGLGQIGASAYAKGEAPGMLLLLTFLISITAFLSAFVTAVSVAALHQAWLSPAVNLTITSTLLIFGVSSYLIEVVYLITHHKDEHTA